MDELKSVYSGIKFSVTHPITSITSLYRLTSNNPEDNLYKVQAWNELKLNCKDYIKNSSQPRIFGRSIAILGTLFATNAIGTAISKGVKGVEIGGELAMGMKNSSIIADRTNLISKYDDIYNYKYNSFDNPGPLAEFRGYPIKNFYGGRYNIEVLSKPRIYYRAGDFKDPLGQWFTETPPNSVVKVRLDTAVREQWIDKNGILTAKSPLNTVYKIEIPAGTTVYKGPVGYQGGIYQGGLDINQVFIKEPWNIEGVRVKGSWPLK